MTLFDLGYHEKLDRFRREQGLEGSDVGRVISVHRDWYLVGTTEGEVTAQVAGNLRFSAQGPEDFPVVRDWVALKVYGEDGGIIHRVFPRFSVISRKAAGAAGSIQVIAANVDYGLLIQSVDRDFNPNRLERYLAICRAAGVEPIVVLTKVDTVPVARVEETTDRIRRRLGEIPLVAISNTTRRGYGDLMRLLKRTKTYCMLGSSGVGKSTLVNNLACRARMKTGAVSEHTKKGTHVTTHRELIVLDCGAMIIDNPGMREVGIACAAEGVDEAFGAITAYARGCRFRDCTHVKEIGCAVREAVERGEIERAAYENYLRMRKEQEHFGATLQERRRKDRAFGRMVRQYKKMKRMR
ncbi:ribosome biogenesis GTPase RsgA [Spirochaeta thermophila DSM 6578]|uniref:Small ribosomal subunit biogenesis GTPase RsgA n=1 Tax=Winmispira thermophila (strain ATCC 700085 / DSM 6578 / Z-1203) TaxID=869211 RepID=G0GAQ2_WINT7|nr:ribosome small subunit-dependent GTPase A [Spirochaeta thermophila]AEJ61017.1 ribosome biogenesis GTPase RsgA [Spirochaeta thermophila DSM 6578]